MEAVTETLDHASPATAHDRGRVPVVTDQQPASGVVALRLRVGGEALEVGEGHREFDRRATVTVRVTPPVGCGQHVARGDRQRSASSGCGGWLEQLDEVP
jgi:hypothetical protein